MARIDGTGALRYAVPGRTNGRKGKDRFNTWLLPHMAACLAIFGTALQSGALYAAEPEEPLVAIVDSLVSRPNIDTCQFPSLNW